MHYVCGIPLHCLCCIHVCMLLFSLLAYYNDIVVGAVCCRIDQAEDARRLYIMTLGCLAPYRRLGIGKLTLSLSAMCYFLFP